MAERVAVLGAGMTKLDDRKGGQKLDDMVFEATRAALLDSGITQKEIDSVVLVGCDEFDGRSISSMLVAAAGGSYLNDEIKVTDDGIYGVILAAMRILSGLYDLSVIVSWCKPSEAPVSNVMNMRWGPFYHRPFGLNHISTAALMAGAYLDRYKGSEDAAAAYRQAGIREPAREIRVAEMYAPFTLYELPMVEALGFCRKGESGRLNEEGFFNRDGRVAVNPSGGTLCTNAIAVAALARICDGCCRSWVWRRRGCRSRMTAMPCARARGDRSSFTPS